MLAIGLAEIVNNLEYAICLFSSNVPYRSVPFQLPPALPTQTNNNGRK